MSKTKQPHVSIILPTYNREATIARAIRTVLSQSYQDFELLVVDDASQDATEEIVRGFDDPRLIYVKQPANGGAAATRNAGLLLVRGEIVAFQDSDDEWMLDKLEKQVAAFEQHPEAVVVYCGMFYWDGMAPLYEPLRKIEGKEGAILPTLLRANLIGTQLLAIRKDALQKAGNAFDENVRRMEDWELAIRLAKLGDFIFLDEPLVKVNVSGDSISHVDLNRALDLEYILTKHASLFSSPRLLAQHYRAIGHFRCASGDLSGGREWLFRSMKLYPLSVMLWGSLCLSLLGQASYQTVAQRVLPFWRRIRRW